MNNMAQASGLIQQPYPDVGQLTSPYEQQQSAKDLNQYATLKAVGEESFAVVQTVKKMLVSVLLRKRTQTFKKKKKEYIYVPVPQTPSEKITTNPKIVPVCEITPRKFCRAKKPHLYW